MIETLAPYQGIFSIVGVVVSLFASGHALINKKDPRSSLWWVSINLFLPILGPLLYYFFGINRIKRKAHRLRRRSKEKTRHAVGLHEDLYSGKSEEVHAFPLLKGNKIESLVNGEEAYPAMLEAISQAKFTIGLASYIFNRDQIGLKFAEALEAAVHRGVQVRVLLDDVGDGFFWVSIHSELQKRKIPCALFLPTLIPSKLGHVNLRNHRKILTVDGKVAFTGGMNIAMAHYAFSTLNKRCGDIHFRLEGPTVAQIQEAFQTDWHFATDENLTGKPWFPELENKGAIHARAIADGPDENIGKTRWTIIAALAQARKSVRILTPYFLPDVGLITALQIAAINGVQIDILVPKAMDWVFVQWASQSMLRQAIEMGCRVWENPPPFQHGKLMIVDDEWILFGSSNWDARSLRLNFEFNVECRDNMFAENLKTYFDGLRSEARAMTIADFENRPLRIKLRDGFARLFTPIL